MLVLCVAFASRTEISKGGCPWHEYGSVGARQATHGQALVRDLNETPGFVGLIDEENKYDAVLCCVGVQYLQNAEAVFAEVGRILKRNTCVVIISFTNRFFYEKALQGWINRGMRKRVQLVKTISELLADLRIFKWWETVSAFGNNLAVWVVYRGSFRGCGGSTQRRSLADCERIKPMDHHLFHNQSYFQKSFSTIKVSSSTIRALSNRSSP